MPEFNDSETPQRPVEDLRRVARYQRWVILTFLVEIPLWAVGGPQSTPVLIAGCVGGIFAFLIYWTIRNPLWAIVMGAASVVPFLGLLVLAVVNCTTSDFLGANGISAGTFGADLRPIEEAHYLSLYEEDAGW